MTYRIAVCDDSAADAAYVSKTVDTWASARRVTSLLEVFSSAEQFLFHYAEDKAFDILLLDIEMPAMNGIDLAKRIRRENESVQIIFITGFPNFVAEGYDVSALHYLMKPVNKEKLFSVLDRAAATLQKAERVLLLPVDGETLRLRVSSIAYAEAAAHSVMIATENGVLSVKKSFSEVESLLGEGFVRCHRSYVVNLKHIARLSRTEVILDDGQALPLSRSAAVSVHKAFISYYTGEKNETL